MKIEIPDELFLELSKQSYNSKIDLQIFIEQKLGTTGNKYFNHGKKWSKNDVQTLVDSFLKHGKDIKLKELSNTLGRTPGAILGKLSDIGQIHYDSLTHVYFYYNNERRYNFKGTNKC